VAYNSAKLTVQGLLVVLVGLLEAQLGTLFAWQMGFATLAALTAALAAYHAHTLPAGEPQRERVASLATVAASTSNVVATFFRNGTGPLVGLLLLYRVVEGQLARIVPLFLLDPRQAGGLGLDTAELGVLYGAVGCSAFVGGSLLGGWLSSRLGTRRMAVPLCLAFNLPGAMYLLLAWQRPHSLLLIGLAIAAEQLAYGVGYVGLKLATLSAAEGPYQTAHCAFAGALAGLGALAAGMVSGTVQSGLGYRGFFAWAVVASAVPLFAARMFSKQESHK
jgi:PAT family beta-lactamase induction signal transducer AmpG